jgi:NADP-dependent 3-hydroxy acid dehydrogenase YdfG
LADELGGIGVPADVTDAESLRHAVATVWSSLGEAPDIVVNAAGVFTMAPLVETDPADLRRNLAANVEGTFLVIREVLPGMLARGSGLIVNVGSVAGHRAYPHNSAYSASKYGLRGLHEVLLEELRGTGVRATLLEPAACDTSIWDPIDPDSDPHLPDRAMMLRPDEVADAVLFVATRSPRVQIARIQMEASAGES